MNEEPIVYERNYNRDVAKTLTSKLFELNTITLEGEITPELANSIVKQLLLLAKKEKEIRLFINSPGGAVNAGMLIYDVLQSIECPLSIYVTGLAASMAAIIACGGQKGKRFILPHSKMMVHEPLLGNSVTGSTSTIRNISDSLMKTSALTNGIISKHTGKTLEEVEQACSYDHFFDAEEAVDFGLVDCVVDSLF